MSSNCNDQPTPCPCVPSTDTGCLDTYNTDCVKYTGTAISCLQIASGDTLTDILGHLEDVVCGLSPTAWDDYDYACLDDIDSQQTFVETVSSVLCEIMGTEIPGVLTSLSTLNTNITNLSTQVNGIININTLDCFEALSSLPGPTANISTLLGAMQQVMCNLNDDITDLTATTAVALTANDSSTIDFTTSGTGSHTLTGAVKISADANNSISAHGDGIFSINPSLTANDSSTINFTASGTSNHTLTGSVILSADSDNILSIESDGLKATQTVLTANDSSTINFTASGTASHTLTGVVIIDPDPSNIISATGSGLYASASGFTLANNSVTNAILRDSVGYSVIGRSTTTTGDPADIIAGADEVLRRSGSGDLSFGTLVTNNIGDDQVTFAKTQNISTARILGRTTASSGDIEQISIGTGLSLTAGSLSLGTVPISYLSAAVNGNTIDNLSYAQTWEWNTLSGVNGLKLSTNSTLGASQILFDVRASGAMATSSYSAFSAYFENTKTGTNGSNTALAAFASGGTSNYGGVFSGAGGQWGTSAGASIYAQGRMRIEGQIDTYGSSSGIVTIKPAAAAGTWTLTLPTSAGTSGYVLVTDGSGATSWSGTSVPVEGTYTPTLTNSSNIAASTPTITRYIRIGNTVQVFGNLMIDATLIATATELDMSLPIASNLGNDYDLAGSGAAADGTAMHILGNPTSDRATFKMQPVTNTNNQYSFSFTYKVI